MTAGEVAAALRAEASRASERRLLVLTGDADRTRTAAADALDAAGVDPADAVYVGTAVDADADTGAVVPWEAIEPVHAGRLLGTTHDAVVLDWHDECRPNAIGRAVGAVDGGGLLVVLAPDLGDWPDRRDGFDGSLAVPPFAVGDVAGNFRTRLVALLRAHPGVAIVDVDAECGELLKDGRTDPPPRPSRKSPSAPADGAFPAEVYDRCLTDDQVSAVASLERLREAGQAVVVEADRGRGKSSAAGLAAAALALDGMDVLVTAPEYRNAAEVFARAGEVLAAVDSDHERGDVVESRHIDFPAGGTVRFAPPSEAVELPGDPDVVIVDEAAALPVRVLDRLLAAPAVAFVTTVHGYEGAGRGFSVRFRDSLVESDHEVTDVEMTDPIRYAAGDPVKTWAFRALGLDASPAVEPLVEDATPESVDYRAVDPADLIDDEHLLRETFGLLVYAHYRTEPDDLARLLDAPNLAVRALVQDGHVVSVALLAREGDLPADLRAEMYEGARVRGNMIPDVLTSQLRDEDAGRPVGQRVMRIATHPAVRSRGLGTHLLSRVRAEFADEVDWIGTGYGATPELLRFWRANDFRTVHLSTTRNDASGEYSAVMLAPTSDVGRALHDRHAREFARRVGAVLSDPLSDVDPDVVRETLRSVDATPAIDLSEWEWRLVAGMASGAGIFDTSPRPLRRLAVRYLVDCGGCADADEGELGAEDPADDGPRPLTAREERLLVRKALQGAAWKTVTDELDFHARSECMRALGEAVGPLVERYGTDAAKAELERFR